MCSFSPGRPSRLPGPPSLAGSAGILTRALDFTPFRVPKFAIFSALWGARPVEQDFGNQTVVKSRPRALKLTKFLRSRPKTIYINSSHVCPWRARARSADQLDPASRPASGHAHFDARA